MRALAEAIGAEPTSVAARMMGDWTPSAEWLESLTTASAGADASQPYPFFLAAPLEGAPETLGDRGGWLVEWKWDGIRAKLIRRRGQTWLWSRGESHHPPLP
jgi:DNA ligase-1